MHDWSEAQARLAAMLKGLAQADSPVSFLDALLLVRLARRSGELPDALIAGLLALHDAPHLTLGGRQVLGDFLRSLAQRQAQQRALAARPIRRTDHGKLARAPLGARLELALGPADAWQVNAVRGGVRLHPRSAASGAHAGVSFDVELVARGPAYVELSPTGTAARAPQGPFVLRLIVE